MTFSVGKLLLHRLSSQGNYPTVHCWLHILLIRRQSDLSCHLLARGEQRRLRGNVDLNRRSDSFWCGRLLIRGSGAVMATVQTLGIGKQLLLKLCYGSRLIRLGSLSQDERLMLLHIFQGCKFGAISTNCAFGALGLIEPCCSMQLRS